MSKMGNSGLRPLGIIGRVKFCLRRLFVTSRDLGERFLPPDAAAGILDSAGFSQYVPCSEPAANHSYACALGAVSTSSVAEQIAAFTDSIRSTAFEMRVESDFRKTVIPVHIANLQHLAHWAAALSQGMQAQHLQHLPGGPEVLGWLLNFTMYIKSVQLRLVAFRRKSPGPSAAEIETLITQEIPSSLEWLFHRNIIPEQSREALRIHGRLLDDLAMDADVISRRCLCQRPAGILLPLPK